MLNYQRVLILALAAVVIAAMPALFVPFPALGQVQQKQDNAARQAQAEEQARMQRQAALLQAQAAALQAQVLGQVGKQPLPKQPEYTPGIKFSAIKLVENEEYQKSIDQAIDAIDGGDWQDACDYVQAILDSKEDVFVKIEIPDPRTGGKKSHSISVKFLANNLLATLPKEGLNTYEVKFGALARQMLDQAKVSGSREVLVEVAARFRHTKAGADANELLATTFLDRGEYFPAALRYERLIGPDPGRSTVSDLVLFKATLAFKRAGDDKKAGELWEALLPRLKTKGGLALANGQVAPIKQVQDILSQGVKLETANPHDWPLVGGNVARNAQAKGSPPILDYVLWQRPTFMDKSEDTGEVEAGGDAKPYLDAALNGHLKNPNNAVIPGGFPIAAGGVLYYRTYNGITGVYLHDVLDKDGKLEAKAGSICFRTTPFAGALGNVFDVASMKGTVGNWITNVYMNSGFSNLLFENSTVGTMTTDNRNIYAVDDLAVPIPPKFLLTNFWNSNNYVSDDVKPLVNQNRLRAFNISSGKIEWELPEEGNSKSEFLNTHFLCSPIAVGGRLYVLNEKNNGELRLICLDPANGKLIGAAQKLGTVKTEHGYKHDIARRATAIHLAYAEGILVCPTNAGEILGVDLMSQSLAWAYKYRDKPPNPQAFPKQNDQNPFGVISLSYSNWKVAPPMVVAGKVVFTAPDASALCCINLRDGTEVWSQPQKESDLYLAGVFLDKVVVVGKNSVRALKLADGTTAGVSLLTGDVPSGQGVASNNTYYLPLRKGEICAIDLDKWLVKAHNRANKTGGASPGNLVFYEGMVLSQSPTAIVAYPQLATKLAEAEATFTKQATVQNLFHRAELRLADGQTQNAVDDLLAVLGKEPPAAIVPRAKSRLFEALSDLLQTEFDKASVKYLTDFKELTKVPGKAAEQNQREAGYWRIVGHGREAQGNLVEAFLAYKQYGASPLFEKEGIPSLEDPLYKVPTHLWLRGRISAMFQKATPAQRAGLEERIGEEWAAVKKKSDVQSIRQFIGMFDVPFAVGREARIELAHAILQSKAKNAFLEAELNLQQLRVGSFRKDAEVGGKALYALAQLEIAKGTEESLRLAATYYRELAGEFDKVVIHAGKTGSDLFQALAEDPRLRAFLEEPVVTWNKGDIKHRELRPPENQEFKAIQGFVFHPEGDLTAVMRQHRLVLDASNQGNPTLRLVDIATNKPRWSTTLGGSSLNLQFFTYLFNQTKQSMGFYPTAKFRFYQVKGHLGVIQVGMEAYGIDLTAGKVLWRHTLYDPAKAQPNSSYTVMQDEQGRLWVSHITPLVGGATKARVGQVGAVQATYVALITYKGLVALDPLKGTPLWTKAGLATNTEIFGDDQHIFYVETADGAAVGAGRCLRASDGAAVDVPDFGFFYRNQQRIFAGRQILTAEPTGRSVTMRLYDALTGKDVWQRTFNNDPAVLVTGDPDQCGVIERDTGKLTLLNAHNAQEIVTANMLQYRVSAQELKQLHQPVILDDGENFFVALNGQGGNTRLVTNSLSNNFASGIPCLPVNGWLCCLNRKGEFLWHGHDRYFNQLVVVEQFKSLPILLLTSRYREQMPTGGVRTLSQTGSISKIDGKAIWWAPERDISTNPQTEFFALSVDPKAGVVNMFGMDRNEMYVHQHFVENKGAAKKGGGDQ